MSRPATSDDAFDRISGIIHGTKIARGFQRVRIPDARIMTLAEAIQFVHQLKIACGIDRGFIF
jgi:hypothetical protein